MASLVEGANGGTQFSVNCYFSGQISVNYSIVLASSQLTTNYGLLIVVVRISNVARSFFYESSMPKDMTCARMRKYIELRDKL